MKNTSLVFLALFLAITLTSSEIVVERGNKPDAASKCPFLENHQQYQSQLQCPYLNGTEDGTSSCPYLKGNSEYQTGCPYLDGGMNGECPYLKENGQKAMKEIKYLPLPEGKNT